MNFLNYLFKHFALSFADNIPITSGSGITVKTDEIGGVHYQQIKLVDGNLDSTSPIGVKDNPLIVSILNTGGIAQVTGGVTILSSIYLNVNVNTFTGGTVSLLNTPSVVSISGGVSILSIGQVSLSGGVTLLSSTILTVKDGGIDYASVGYTPTWIYAALSSDNQTVVWKPEATKRFNITDLTVNALTAGLVTFTQDSAATVTLMKVNLGANGGWAKNLTTPFIATQTNHGLVVTSTVAGTNTYLFVSGYESL